MLIIELTYKKPLSEVNELLEQHRAFLDKYYAKKLFIASGPKEPREGGIILSMGNREIMNKILQEDPFHQKGIADYRIIQFEPNRCSDDCEKIFMKPNVKHDQPG